MIIDDLLFAHWSKNVFQLRPSYEALYDNSKIIPKKNAIKTNKFETIQNKCIKYYLYLNTLPYKLNLDFYKQRA